MEHLRARFRFIAGNRISFLKRAAAYYKGAKRHPAASQPLLSKICTNEVVPIAAGSPEFVRVPERVSYGHCDRVPMRVLCRLVSVGGSIS